MSKKDDATRMTDLIYDTLRQMCAWGAGFSVDRMFDRKIEVSWPDNTKVEIKISVLKDVAK